MIHYQNFKVYAKCRTGFMHVLTVSAASVADAEQYARQIIPSCFKIIIREETKNGQQRSDSPTRGYT